MADSIEQDEERQGKSLRGFAVMDQQKQREIASKGGRAAHAKGNAHEFTPDEAQQAGRKGGEVVSADRGHMSTIGRKGGRAVSSDRGHMAAIGRKGGEAVSSDRGHMSNIGRKGGEAVSSDRAHMSNIGREGGNSSRAGSAGMSNVQEQQQVGRQRQKGS